MKPKLIRDLKLTTPFMVGEDVEAIRRSCKKYLRESLNSMPKKTSERRTFGPGMRDLVKRAQDEAVQIKSGFATNALLTAMRRQEGAVDAYADFLLAKYASAHQQVVLIEPLQGFDSLDRSLWEAYSIGRRAKLTDLGTYNPRSKLPTSGRPSDHATGRKSGRVGQPVVAFDLGFWPQTGQGNRVAREFFEKMIGRPEVNYVILGNKIWSVSSGLHSYSFGGHDGHVHVSGHRR